MDGRHGPEGRMANLFDGVAPCDGCKTGAGVKGLFGDDAERVGNHNGSETFAPSKSPFAHSIQCLWHSNAGETVVFSKSVSAYRLHVCRQRNGGERACVKAVVEDVGDPSRNVNITHPGIVLEATKDFYVRVQRDSDTRLVARNQRVVTAAI